MSKLPMRVLTLIGSLALVGGVAACSSADDDSGGPSVAPSTVPASTTTLAPTTTEPATATDGAPSSADAAAMLVEAWHADDRAAAAKIADAQAVDGIFATPDTEMWLRGCTIDDALPEGGCIYRTASGLVQINTEKRDHGWVVSSAVYDPLEDGNEVHGDAPEGPQD